MEDEEPLASAPCLPNSTSTEQKTSAAASVHTSSLTPPTLQPSPSPLPSRVLFPHAPYHAILDGCSVLLPLPSPSSPPHDLTLRQYGVQGADGRCRLTLCEAFFLLHALDALTVTGGDGRPLTAAELLAHGCESNERFLSLFAAFAHWTALGWVVRQGSKMGADFLLYAHQPLTTRTHSTSEAQRYTPAHPAPASALRWPPLTIDRSLSSPVPRATRSFSVLVVEEDALQHPLGPATEWEAILRVQRTVKKVRIPSGAMHATRAPSQASDSTCAFTLLPPVCCACHQRLLACTTVTPNARGVPAERLQLLLPSCRVSCVVGLTAGLHTQSAVASTVVQAGDGKRSRRGDSVGDGSTS